MNLDTFVSETLKALIKGVNDTQSYARENNSRINPIRYDAGTIDGMKKMVYFGKEEHARPLTMVEFDVAVTASSQTESGISGGISVFSFTVGGKNIGTDINQIVSRIKFNLGIVLPHTLD